MDDRDARMTLVTHPDGSTHTIADPSIQQGRRIVTRLRLADGSSVPIELMWTPDGWLQVVDPKAPRTACNRGHVYTERTMYVDKRGYRVCKTCQLMLQRIKRQHLKQQKGK